MEAMMSKMMSNPKAMALMQKAQSNPKLMAALQEVQTNGAAAMSKFANDPEISSVITELQEILGTSLEPSVAAEDEEESAPPPLQGASGFTQTFIPATSFAGAKEGYLFKTGPRGLGYYRDGAHSSTAQPQAEAKVAEVEEEDLDELD